MHKQIKSQLQPFEHFPRITRIADLEALTANDINDFKDDFPALVQVLESPEPAIWLDSDYSRDEIVAQNIADTLASIPADLLYSRERKNDI